MKSCASTADSRRSVRCGLAPLAVLLLTLAGCRGQCFEPDVHAILDAPDAFEIYALKPDSKWEGVPEGAALFHGYAILGQAMIADRGTSRRMMELVYDGISASDGTVAACFNPRHGIRAVKGSETVDLVICYECLSMQVHGPAGASASETTVERVGADLTKLFAAAGVTIAK